MVFYSLNGIFYSTNESVSQGPGASSFQLSYGPISTICNSWVMGIQRFKANKEKSKLFRILTGTSSIPNLLCSL